MKRYTFRDLIALAALIAKPVTDAIRAEFAPHAKPVAPAPAVELPTPVEVIAEPVAAEIAPEAEAIPVEAVEPAPQLFIKVQKGKSTRYQPASETAVGLRYVKVMKGKRTTYQLAGNGAERAGSPEQER